MATTMSYLEKFNLAGDASRSRLFVNSNDALIKMFSAGIGFGTLTQEIAKPFLQSGDLIALNSGAPLENRLALACYPRKQMPKYLGAIISAIK